MSKMSDKDIVQWIIQCRDEAKQAKRDRMSLNKDNFSMFHLEHDFTHKEEGQSTEILSKQSMAVEQIKSFFQQALADIGDWWKAEPSYHGAAESMPIKPDEITTLTNYMLKKAGYFSHVGNQIQSALLAALSISKTYGVMVSKPKFVSRKKGRGKQLKRWVEKIEDKTWEMRFETVRAENFYPDPKGKMGKGLYIVEDMWCDYHEVLALAEGDEAIYDKAAVDTLTPAGVEDIEESAGKARETGQNPEGGGHRPRIKITELWGTILDKNGKICYENCVATIANDTTLIRHPEGGNPLWHQSHPYNFAPLLEVANSVWHKALMDAPTKHNRALIELYNLFVDAAMRQVHAINQLRKDALDNPAQVANGIKPGMTLLVNSSLAPGTKVLEPLTAVQVPAEAFNIYNIMGQEFNASSITNDLRQGVMPFRAVKATEVVEASQTITSVFQGIAKNYEEKQSVRELELAWKTTAQNWDKISLEEFQTLFGKERGSELKAMAPEDVFAATVSGVTFRVFGISLTLSKAQDYRKLTTLLQTIGTAPALMEEYLKKYDLGMLLGEIMTALDIDKHKLKVPESVAATMATPQPGAPEQGPDQMSQVSQAGAGTMADIFGGPQFPQTQFPGSPATVGQGG